MRTKPVVAFVCIHNACRSQIAEALGRQLASDVFTSCSAGTKIGERLNPDAVRLLRDRCGIDMTAAGQHPKMLSDEDWGLEDPTGKGDAAFLETIRLIREKVLDLRERILQADNEEESNG